MRFIARSLFVLAALLWCAPAIAADAPAKKKVVFIAGGPSHGFFAHDHLAGCKLLAKRVADVPGFESEVFFKDWPAADVLASASAVVIYCDGGAGHLAIKHSDELKTLSAKGVGVGFIHYAVEVPTTSGPTWLTLTGGYFEINFSVNPHWLGQFASLPKHPAANGVKPFQTNDEWYYHMRFRDDMKGVTPILTAIPPDATRSKKDDAHGGNPTVRAGIGKNLPEHVLWVSENEGGSRGFGCTGGHFHKNWASDNFRKTVLNSIVWIAKGEVPADGINSPRPDVEELLANRDPGVKGEQAPENFDKAKLAAEIEEMNKPFDPNAKSAAQAPKAGEELLKTIAAK